jgi:peptide/nickel transport system substrate-binding protein
MNTTRRNLVGGGLAGAALIAAPGLVRAQSPVPKSRTIRAVMHGDLRSFDPVWTTAIITIYHGGMIYDSLFGMDSEMRPQPQMVSKFGVSDDKKTYTFELRDGLKFSDGSPVTAADCVASVRRWAARDGAGQHLFLRVKDTPVKDDRTFAIVLREPYGLVVEALAKVSTNVCYVMRKREAETDPNQQISAFVGSGPFMLNQQETKHGASYVYDRNPLYVPRAEAASGTAGGKVVRVDRVVFDNMDELTAVSALQAGEIDFHEVPPIDVLGQLQSDPKIKVEILNKAGNIGSMRLNFLFPPFDRVEARRAMLHLVDQNAIMQSTFVDPKYYRSCGSYFGCGTPMENDAGTGWFSAGQDIAKAKELFRQAGYDGRPVVILQATNIAFVNNATQLVAQWLRQAGVNAQLAASDWGGVVTRRSSKKPPDQGGWNIFVTWSSTQGISNPIAHPGHATTGEKAWFGWPSDDKQEGLRDKWAAASSVEDRRSVARELQDNAWSFVPGTYLGQWAPPVAYRANLRGFLPIPDTALPFWNVEKAA